MTKPNTHVLNWFASLVAVNILNISLAWAQNPKALQEIDPTRIWQGKNFIQSTLAWLGAYAPGTKLTAAIPTQQDGLTFGFPATNRNEMSASEFEAAFMPTENLGVRAKSFIDGSGSRLIPHDVRSLGETLYRGGRIDYSSEGQAVSAVEQEIQKWILTQNDSSVAPHELLARTIILANGDSIKALTVLWNLLNQDWSSAATRNFNVLTSKLVDVTGEAALKDATGEFVILPENHPKAKRKRYGRMVGPLGAVPKQVKSRIDFVVSKRGDKFSTYYHFFGVALMSAYVSHRTGSEVWGTLFGKGGAWIESIKHSFTAGGNREKIKRVANDYQGAEAGLELYRRIKEGPGQATMDQLEASHYLVSDPRFAKNYPLKPGQSPAYHGLQGDSQWMSKAMAVDELKMRFHYAVWISGEIFNPIILSSSTTGERLQLGLEQYLNEIRSGGTGDPELNELLKLYSAGNRGRAKGIATDDFSLQPTKHFKHVASQFPDYDLTEILKRVEGRISQLVLLLDRSQPAARSCNAIFGNGG